jgi:hypothetical protein
VLMPDVTPQADAAELGTRSRGKPRRSPLGAARRLSERTPLRTKLITAVLALVIMALAAISIASVYMLRGYVTTQRDSQLIQDFQGIPTYALSRVSAGNAAPTNTNMVLGIQLPGHQLSWPTSSNNQYINGGAGPGPLPSLPTSAGWASGNSLTKLTVPSQSGGSSPPRRTTSPSTAAREPSSRPLTWSSRWTSATSTR